MRAYHNTRDRNCRTPYGALDLGSSVTLALDVWDAPGAHVVLRTWIDGEGEQRYPMERAARNVADDGEDSTPAVPGPDRFEIVLAPQEAGVTWYYFIIVDADGHEMRYGAQDGKRGGEGQLRAWEPPSFQLTVCRGDGGKNTLSDTCTPVCRGDGGADTRDGNEDANTAHQDGASLDAHALDRPFADMRADYLRGELAPEELVESIETLRENCSASDFRRIMEPLCDPLEPGLGVLAHITSLPPETPDAQGTLGPIARRFVDTLADAGVRYWQILPLNPTDEYGSPYAGISAFAGNTRLLEMLTEGTVPIVNIDAFCERERDWLEPYAYFMAIREKVGPGIAWQDWPEGYRRFDPAALGADPQLAAAAERHKRAQFAFQQQWSALRAYANERGVRIIGDIPIYVSADSADVWAHPELFQLGPDGRPEAVAGCPPDAFAPEGQIWGNPLYDWDALRTSGYAWWLRRLERAFGLYDLVRLDHFIGFERYFAIPASQEASAGAYRPGPGFPLFQAAYEKFGPLPIIAEDLGVITPAVRALVGLCGFPGMDVLQFVDNGDPLAGYEPRPGKIAYTGTHDNQTLVAYCEERYPLLDARETARALVNTAVASDASVCVVPLQDVLLLGNKARMNEPGTVGGNWMWQATAEQLEGICPRLRELAALRPTR